jgi:hypothetical protein
MDYDQYRPATSFKNKLKLMHVLLQSFASIPHQQQMMACGSNRNKQQQNSSGHHSKHIFVNSRHGL